jgi:hypothetical protein
LAPALWLSRARPGAKMWCIRVLCPAPRSTERAIHGACTTIDARDCAARRGVGQRKAGT